MSREVIDYKALAERIEEIADYCSNDNMWGESEVADLRTVVTMLNEAAEAKPVAWVEVSDSYEGPYAFHGKELLPIGRHGLYLHPAPQPQPCIGNDPACPCQDGDPCHYRDHGDTKAMPIPQPEPVSDPRPCTCHPDDNPPVPCAQQYALNECRAASGEPTEARIAWPVRADEGMLRAMLSWRECDEREGLSGEASMLDRVYHALYSHMRDRAALAAKESQR